MNITDFKNFIESSSWIFAKTMPQNPHWYTLRKNCPDSVFCDAVTFIREQGKRVYLKGRTYIQYVIDDYTYWTMGNPMEQTILINRVKQN
jgi:hypothetical protein